MPRAELHAASLPLHNLFGGTLWFASQPAHWIASLFREIVQMQTASFCDIEATARPADFTAMWDEAINFYRGFQEPEQHKTENGS